MTPLQLSRSVRSLNRLRHIAKVLTRHGFGHIVAQLDLGRFVPTKIFRRREPKDGPEPGSLLGRRLAQVCADLGPTFVKLGPFLSTRPDIVPSEVLKELRKLQDQVPAFDTKLAGTSSPKKWASRSRTVSSKSMTNRSPLRRSARCTRRSPPTVGLW